MIIRSNPATIAFLDRYIARTIIDPDDQTALNHLLAEAPIGNITRQPDHLSLESMGLSWVCPNVPLVSRDLGYGSVIRHFQQCGDSIAELQQGFGLARPN